VCLRAAAKLPPYGPACLRLTSAANCLSDFLRHGSLAVPAFPSPVPATKVAQRILAAKLLRTGAWLEAGAAVVHYRVIWAPYPGLHSTSGPGKLGRHGNAGHGLRHRSEDRIDESLPVASARASGSSRASIPVMTDVGLPPIRLVAEPWLGAMGLQSGCLSVRSHPSKVGGCFRRFSSSPTGDNRGLMIFRRWLERSNPILLTQTTSGCPGVGRLPFSPRT